MSVSRQRLLLPVLNHATLILFAVVLAVFGLLSPKFFTAGI